MNNAETIQADQASKPWTYQDAAELYGVERWGNGYFAINDLGHLQVHPNGDAQDAALHGIDVKQLVDELQTRGLQPPMLIRFSDILKHRVCEIHEAFKNAIHENDYQSSYHCIYPIKVNQQRHVVEEMLEYGREYGMGVEAGSKPELLAVMAMVDNDKTPIICNGFKDDEFIEAVILAAKIGKNIIPVVEKFSELRAIARFAKLHDVKPNIGVRVKLTTKTHGRWEASGGMRSKFGLFTSELVEAVQYLKEHDMTDCLKLLHFHIGSQSSNIEGIKRSVTELARMYVELHQLGVELKYLDIGGGLGIDYQGTKTDYESSINYSLDEYASNIVYHIKETCDRANIKHPTIISESGRALVAYHSLLIINVVDWSGFDRFELPEKLDAALKKELPHPVTTLFNTYNDINQDNFNEYYHDAQVAWEQTLHLFQLGYCSLEIRGLAERLYFSICSRVLRFVRTLEELPEAFENLEQMLADTYFCNWSLFQSLPDSWAIDQLFPIMPIHRLDEEPTCRGILADITCDSDGKVDRFIDGREAKRVLELHPYLGDDYYLGIALVGAYQEILGDLHNLFGDTNAVHVKFDEDGEVEIDEVVEGDSVAEVLAYVQFSSEELMRKMRKRVEKALRNKRISLEESRLLLRFYDSGLKGYTYLE